MAARTKTPAVGSSGWILEERHQSNDLVSQELEDFGFSVRNELEWLNEHMSDIFANDGQHNLEVFKTPGKLRGKTPHTARKKNPAEPRQPLANILSANGQKRPSPAEQSLKNNLQKSAKARFHIAEDTENTVPVESPVAKTPIARQLFTKSVGTGKENVESRLQADMFDERSTLHTAAPWSPVHSTQDTVMSSQDDDVFSPPQTQSTQPTQATQSFRRSISEQEDERRDTGDSFVSAKEAFASKNTSKDNLREKRDDAMDLDDRADLSRSDTQDTMIRHELSSAGEDDDEDMQDIPDFPQPPRVISEQYSISAETHDALDTANHRALAPEPKNLFAPDHSTTPAGPPPASFQDAAHDDTVVHHDIDDQMDIDDDVRSPSDGSSPVKPLVRKSSLTFASLPAREPLLAKKSMGNRVSRTSHVDPSKARSSQMGRFTGGKSLGGSQVVQPVEAHHDEDVDVDMDRPELQREESETTKIHNKTSTQRLFERINMLKQQNEAPKRVSQNVLSSQPAQPQSFSSTQPKDDVPHIQSSQPSYPNLPSSEATGDDDDDDWISPVRTAAVAPKISRPAFSKSHSATTQSSPPKAMPSKLTSVSNPDLSIVVESTTPVGSPTSKKYMDGPLSASKSKLYSAFRAAKEKLIGSSATSAQAKLDALHQSPARQHAQDSSDDIFSSPKRTEKPGSIFSHLRSPSKESKKSAKGATMPSSPTKESRRTRSSTEREKHKEKETRERETKDAKQQRAEAKLREMREKEQLKAAAHHHKSKHAGAKTPSATSSQSSLRQPNVATAATKTPVQAAPQQQPLSRPAITRVNTASSREDIDSADEMPPPPPPKSQLPTTKTTKAALREPRKLAKPSSKDALPKAKAPQKIMVNLNSTRYGQAPPTASRPTPATTSKPLPIAPQGFSKSTASAPKAAPARPASALSTKSGPAPRAAPPTTKPAAPRVARPQPQAIEKPKAPAPQPRADLGAARPVSRMQTVQDANRINVPPVNPAKPPKRPFQGENDETLHRPAKRPSQQAKMNPMTPAHAQFAKGKIPFAEPAHAPQPQIQYPNGDDIKLPEIMTDSEDEDSENEFEQPSWVNTPNLREMLSNQQLMDPETIFGPIAPLEMEKVFPNKERHKRFRERTSSAYWANDQVTEEERRKEREARERLVKEGAWTYNPSPRPTAGPSR
ncbi:uncharacterized protein K460DRAFT_416693 [Cucurbitaria berberidis CBS 394.84]|uniref:Inner centromere protein ARK-binding domain-containing protein n=1 Tax=Cucurbitaria berberidis CBS 394.84 TaxID=1168544 RepID=A0A9P4GG31_9PLEO|nr:uncharacterized protein K460DRAFT_416693 [Cucurbitaria berberidis CBS 394.84]KAF1845433.1 hypothetical protein K460DRAFT_416693 [Cucurbitaria berberidis CBS 394.84]